MSENETKDHRYWSSIGTITIDINDNTSVFIL